MAAPKVRPTFEISSELTPSEVVACLQAGRACAEGKVLATFIREKVEIVPHPSVVHTWSPQLTLVLAEAEGGTRIRGRFAAHPNVWSLYLAIHALGAFGTIGAAVYGISQHLTGERPWALWALPIAPVLAALVWAFAFVGQNLAFEQMHALRKFVEDALAHPDAPAVPAEHTARAS